MHKNSLTADAHFHQPATAQLDRNVAIVNGIPNNMSFATVSREIIFVDKGQSRSYKKKSGRTRYARYVITVWATLART